MEAAASKSLDVVKMLLGAGADVNAIDQVCTLIAVLPPCHLTFLAVHLKPPGRRDGAHECLLS
jgi:hypothetical protein